MSNEVHELRSPVYKINAIIPNRWHARSILQVGIALSLIALATIFINSTTHVHMVWLHNLLWAHLIILH